MQQGHCGNTPHAIQKERPHTKTDKPIPVCMLCVASMTAFMPEAHTLLTVEQTVAGDSPAPRAACLAGACIMQARDHTAVFPQTFAAHMKSSDIS